jgi:hypothetical protein
VPKASGRGSSTGARKAVTKRLLALQLGSSGGQTRPRSLAPSVSAAVARYWR